MDMEEVQPIIPVADLVKIGVQVEWTATGCSMNNEQRVFDPRDPITLSEDDWSVHLLSKVFRFHDHSQFR